MNTSLNHQNLYIKTLSSTSPNFLNNASVASLICFSHLRWDFVYQRPQHIISRFTKTYKVYYWEEPIFIDGCLPSLKIKSIDDDLIILTPQLPIGFRLTEINQIQRNLLDSFIEKNRINLEILWYYTPMSFCWSSHLKPKVLIYDCMDELSAFKFAPPELKEYERLLMARADLVFTGGKSLYEAKKLLHKSVYAFPSSVDIEHFIQARYTSTIEPEDQRDILYPRLGFYGVIDERLDIKLLEEVAKARPEWNLIIVGPVVKIDPESLPKLPNIHYLGKKDYSVLPNYLSGWDIALLPFALNESTRFISPTKTPEYLAAGKPVVSTPITDVVSGYSNCNIVRFAHPDYVSIFIKEIENSLQDANNIANVYAKADDALKDMSWDKTYEDMHELILSLSVKEKAS
ncbi:MAG: glycosyltransferase family 1 protein [Burkholderiales bacterium]|nr:glycosyltransferase family 1 protein [Burkholderiales bacterium]